MYHQLFTKLHGFLPKFLSPISHFHFSTKIQLFHSKLGFVLKEVEELQSLKPKEEIHGGKQESEKEDEVSNRNGHSNSSVIESNVQLSHPWPEWIDMMELLLKKGLFQEAGGRPFDGEGMGTKDSNRIRTACLNFARDRFDLIRYFSRRDIRVIMESGCPSIDRKVVNSGKRLRAHVGLDEGKVCSICSLRGSCERAYVKARDDEGGRTIDVMRILLTYGLDPITGSVENKPCLSRGVKDSVRRLLREMVEFNVKEVNSEPPKATPSKRLSSKEEHSTRRQIGPINVPMKQGDWICPKCDFMNFAKNIKCLRCNGLFQDRLRKLAEHQDHLPLKKGDWLCEKCNFLNFAKNTRCLQCEEKPPKRHLNPGEWECESCNYINFRKNMVCLKCDWKRPKASNYTGIPAQPQNEERGGSLQSHGMSFVREDGDEKGQPSVRQERHFLKYLEDEDDEGVDGPSTWNRFEDFPVVGGKGDVSQNSQARERWKKQITKKSTRVSKVKESRDSLDCRIPDNLKFLDSNNDGDMAGWFGSGKKIGSEE